MRLRKIIVAAITIILAIIIVSLFWRTPLFLSFLLILIALIKHRASPIKKELLWFVISGILGTVGESLIMLSESWSYASPSIFNFPLWLPFLWGLAGTTAITIYTWLSRDFVKDE